ncbi:hypothetical protein OIN60_17610 [Paenibacillus sp. P96]|uniref:Uncharacterized protein n=1 Tax=Paenibacillus zeirhizosphaerae TaxID=2987519 RepID=A0ABT9FUZ1_9BACL|nr:hypothetical protein [Paenibacillus sp. P96]MDP4098552.1 hypothetical protein [Paenibacillus sp. P96]
MYREWSEVKQREVRSLSHESVSGDELFLRKLVDATCLNGRLWGHTSHENEDNLAHSVYVTPFKEQVSEPYASAITEVLSGEGTASSLLKPSYWLWKEKRFHPMDRNEASVFTLELARRLLDHYTVLDGRTYQYLYSVLDTGRNSVHFFLEEVDL